MLEDGGNLKLCHTLDYRQEAALPADEAAGGAPMMAAEATALQGACQGRKEETVRPPPMGDTSTRSNALFGPLF